MTLGRLVRFPVASVGYSCLGTLGMRLAVSAGSARIRLLLSVTTPQPVLFAAHSIRQPPVELLAVAFRREGNSLIGSISLAGWSLYCAEAESFGVKLPSSSLSFWR